ncbi:hypothetical protein DCAR_0101404 [Daucus carota subsp. sativus]|uniref:Uncharacterized protein n=1 Tax=Daucus carota subsp. sativus TaxID=79200 RepID=A0A166GCB1_DAUCS|nr:hypothetical protein DCAR_0101404 [Daucus carota subsp. sativus]
MPYFTSFQSILVQPSILMLLFASLLVAQARLHPISSVVKVVQVQFNGFLACTPTATHPTRRGVSGAAGVLVSASCKGTLGTAVTNTSGYYAGLISFEEPKFYDPSRGVPCFVTVRLPAIGSSCQVLPTTGTLRAPVYLVSLTGGQIAIVNAKPLQYVA